MADSTRRIDGWVRAGIISEHQARAIREFEAAATPRRVSAIEVLGYLGAVFLAVGSLVLVGEIWGDLSLGVQIAVPFMTALLLVLVGLSTARDDRAPVRRAARASLLLALAPAGVTAAVAVGTVTDRGEIIGMAAFAVAAAVAIPLYLRDRCAAQHAGVFLSLAALLPTTVAAIVPDVPEPIPGATLVLFGITWAALSTSGKLDVARLGEAFGLLCALIGGVLTVAPADEQAPILGVLVAGAVASVIVGSLLNRVMYVIAGMVGTIVFAPWFIDAVFGASAAGPLTAIVTGALLIGLALYFTRRSGRRPLPR